MHDVGVCVYGKYTDLHEIVCEKRKKSMHEMHTAKSVKINLN